MMKREIKIEFWESTNPALRTDDQKFFWHVRAANGKIVATGGEGFKNFYSAKRAVIGFAFNMGFRGRIHFIPDPNDPVNSIFKLNKAYMVIQ